MKRLFDALVAAAGLLLLSPLLLCAGLAVVVFDGWPVFFFQERIGRRGRPFRIVKFCSMRAPVDGRSHDFDLGNQSRVTRLGRFLRTTKIDELPQLWNVLKGEMSLVGPRPPLPREVEQYEPDALRRLHVRPGMTGLWQVSGRSDLSWEESLRLDLRYVDNWSPIVDLQILFRTFRAVTGGSGAY